MNVVGETIRTGTTKKRSFLSLKDQIESIMLKYYLQGKDLYI